MIDVIIRNVVVESENGVDEICKCPSSMDSLGSNCSKIGSPFFLSMRTD